MADKPQLHVEGPNDLHAIANFLKRHNIDTAEATREFDITCSNRRANNLEALLESMPDTIRAARNRAVGFVLDTDIRCEDRWKAVAYRLSQAGIAPDPECPKTGYTGRIADYPEAHRVGVWLMPDCSQDHGKLETFLKTLIPSEDKLWSLAENSTDQAKKLGANFSDPDNLKAVIHCWLAWQKEPGQPFGVALNAKYFSNVRSPAALAFLSWLTKLFDLKPAVPSPPPTTSDQG